MTRGALAADIAGLELHFDEFQVPVAIVIPYEAVQDFRCQTRAMGFVGLRCLFGSLTQAAYGLHIGEGIAA